MKVLHVISGSLNSGAARGALWLHYALLTIGAQSRILSTHNDINEKEIESVYPDTVTGNLARKFRLAVDVLPAYIYPNRKKRLFSSALYGINLTDHPLYHWAEIIHLHWINAGMLSLAQINKIAKPVVWTMRDMWPFTGGCHYSLDCTQYINGCGRCPLLGSDSKSDLSSWNFKRKVKSIPTRLQPVAISNWLKECAQQSPVMQKHSIEVIHNCVDTSTFSPFDKLNARESMGMCKTEKIILAGALGISSPWKGFDTLIKAVKNLGSSYKLALFGDTANLPPEWRRVLSYDLKRLYNSEDLRKAYAASDVFVAPSRQEAFGKTLIEAMSVATPVTAFNATGPADIVAHKSTGYLSEPFSSDSLADGIRWCCNNNHNNMLGLCARKRVEQMFSPAVIASKYYDHYQKTISAGESGNE